MIGNAESTHDEIASARSQGSGMVKEDIRVLVVDDDESLLGVLSLLLEEEGYRVSTASSGEEALKLFHADHFALVISDVKMPGMSGIDLLKKVKELDDDTEVIIMTSYATLDTAVSALRSGAYDFMIKPFEDIELAVATVNRAIEKILLTKENRLLLEDLTENIRELEELNDVLQDLAVRDGLTGLYNHRFLYEAVTREIVRCQSHDSSFSLIFVDVDHFKQYNDANGHPAGDMLLKDLATFLSKRLRQSDLLARYGGEEFVAVLPSTAKEQALVCAEDLRRMIAEHPFGGWKGQPLGCVSVSMGVASYPEDGTAVEDLLKSADDALYRAKAMGRNRVCGSAAVGGA